MKHRIWVLVALLVVSVTILESGFDQKAKAEPWIANRYAQNCAGCHAPSRKNLEFFDRRCTLNCQGCHVNPNGGGIRNRYGVWVTQRWLRSFYVDGYMNNKEMPAPFKKQIYARKNLRPKTKRRAVKKGLPLVTTSQSEYKEKDYDRSDNQWKITAKSEEAFMLHVTDDDPLREERSMMAYGGADLRTFMINDLDGDDSGTNIWLMAVDFGLRFRPVKRYFSLVTEGRFMQGPNDANLEKTFTSAMAKSAYVLVDDLPMNTYVMWGVFRPMFGLYDVDHTSIASNMTRLTQRRVFKGVSVGTSPNVPYFNATYITGWDDNSSFPQETGFILNAGARAVMFGANVQASLWSTSETGASGDVSQFYWSLSGGATLWRVIANVELLRASREFSPGLANAGTAWTFKTRTRFWRENYIVADYSHANVIPNDALDPGSANQISLGVKSFLISGLELETLYRLIESGSTEDNILQTQLHLFF